MERDIQVGKVYRHMSGNYYRVICIAKDSQSPAGEEKKQVVVYESLGLDHTIWVRPYELFQEKVDHEKYPDCVQEYRFELIDDAITFR